MPTNDNIQLQPHWHDETQQIEVDYYEKKFSKGFDYGYIYPAINKCLQGAGRCIRSETDRGILVFLDERFAWGNYFRCFPADWDMVVTKNYGKLVDAFFSTELSTTLELK